MIDEWHLPAEEDGIDTKLVSRLIKGTMSEKDAPERQWLFEIISNKRNSLDVDKMDYLCRDDYHVGLNAVGNQDKINYELIFKSARIVNHRLAYSIKNVNTIKMVYDKRLEMFRAIYNHKRA